VCAGREGKGRRKGQCNAISKESRYIFFLYKIKEILNEWKYCYSESDWRLERSHGRVINGINISA